MGRPQDVLLAFEHGAYGGIEIGLEPVILARVAVEGDFHADSLSEGRLCDDVGSSPPGTRGPRSDDAYASTSHGGIQTVSPRDPGLTQVRCAA